jgi:O-antigen ligase
MPKKARVADRTAVERAANAVLAAGLLITAVITSGGADHFRLPKELAFRAEAVVLVVLGTFWATARRRTWRFALRREQVLALVIVGWAAITTSTSTNRSLSVDALITVVAAAVIFIVTTVAAKSAPLAAVDVLMIGCCVNAVIVILQEMRTAQDASMHYGSVALLGNPNDVGTYLAAPALAAIVLAVTSAGRRRWLYTAIGILLVAGVAASATRTAAGALMVGLVVFGLLHSRRAAVLVLAMIVVMGLVIATPRTALGRGVRELATAARHGDFERLFSERLVPFLAAIDMTCDHPLLGVGPGCFKYHYMPYRVALFHRYPERWTQGYPMNWGEVHNDHLQVAAETGLPGYALFIAAIALCVGRKARGTATTGRAAFARALRWPLAALVFTLCLAQFPLELAAPRLLLLTLGALSIGWDDEHVA